MNSLRITRQGDGEQRTYCLEVRSGELGTLYVELDAATWSYALSHPDLAVEVSLSTDSVEDVEGLEGINGGEKFGGLYDEDGGGYVPNVR